MRFDPEQRAAVDKMKNGCVLCGKVGSGKSRVSLTYFFEKECGGSIEPPFSPLMSYKNLYIITTARKRDDKEWEGELKAFDMFSDQLKNINIVIDSWNNIGKYTEVKDSFFIFDEQRVIGTGAWVTSFFKITSSQIYRNRNSNNHWILLSATPGERWDDYVPVFVANGFFRCRSDMEQRHAKFNPFTPFKKIEGWIYTDVLDNYRKSILVDIDVKQNQRSYFWLKVPYDEEKYKYVAKNRWNIFDNEPIENAAGLCYILRKVVNLNDNRLQELKKIYERHKKVIAFYNFNYELDILRLMCHKFSITKAEWNGQKHESLPSTNSWIYLVQYTAGAEGWNCITTNVVVFFSLNYSYKITEQASGRIDRRNTPYKVLYYYFLVTDSWIDRAIRKALRERKTFNERAYFKNTIF